MELKIGFEIHVQLNTRQKLFCPCSTDYSEEEPNTNICPICTGQPGSKPLPPNIEALRNLIKVGLILGCKPVKKKIYFMRKHYFYPDLPKNYQITSEPVMVDGEFFGVRIREIHLEEDPGRYELRNGYVDFNRSGVPLAEIVTEPDITSAKQAKDWLKKLFFYLKYSKAIRSDPGSVRVDLNISIPGGERVEVKNINSIENVYRAINFEVLRQTRALQMGKKIKRETRHFDEEKKITIPLREKETVADYRYIPDPDLIPFEVPENLIEEVKKEVINIAEIEERLRKDFKLNEDYIRKIMSDPDFLQISLDFLNSVEGHYGVLAEILTNYLKSILEKEKISIDRVKSAKQGIIQISRLLATRKLPKESVVSVLEATLRGEDPIEFAKRNNLLIEEESIEDLEKVVEKVINEEKKAVSDYKLGKKEALNYLIGKVFKTLGKKVDPRLVYELLKKKLEN
jgi:aspartyl-tRNA(Asn)/glutamyl-tRNA(Gln) amidotransferase subunit B